MKNVTISMDDELYRVTRVEAAKAGKSVSRYVADRLRRHDAAIDEDAETRERLARLQEVFDGPKLKISENGRMPTADERNARR